MKRFLIKIKYFLKEKLRTLKYIIKQEKVEITKDKNNVYIFLAADYANMGDVAITYAQKNFIKEILPNYDVVEIPYSKFNKVLHYLKKKIKKQDIITIIGGGNLSNRYESIEEARRMVIKKFKKNKIISFPQTIDFTEDIFGQESLKRTQRIYSKNSNLILIARERKSYKIMKKLFVKNKIILTPDIVMSLKGKIQIDNSIRHDIGVCLRNDKEKLINIDINSYIDKLFDNENIVRIDTHIGNKNLIYKDRYKMLFEILRKIASFKFVVTDRLHGMIFCYLTNTPCIVFDNDNHKISETYNEWLKECNYIKLINESEIHNIKEYIREITSKKKIDVNLIKKFVDIEKSLKE